METSANMAESLPTTSTTVKRSQNFSKEEVDVLVDGVVEFREELFHKQTNSFTNSLKRKRWEEITTRISSLGTEFRSLTQVKKKWKDLAGSIKKKESKRRADVRRTGGGDPPDGLNPLEQKVIAVLGDTRIDGVAGGFDSGSSETALQGAVTLSSIEVVPEQGPAEEYEGQTWNLEFCSETPGQAVYVPVLDSIQSLYADTADGEGDAVGVQMGPSSEASKSAASSSKPAPAQKASSFEERILEIEEEKLKAQQDIASTLQKILLCLQHKQAL